MIMNNHQTKWVLNYWRLTENNLNTWFVEIRKLCIWPQPHLQYQASPICPHSFSDVPSPHRENHHFPKLNQHIHKKTNNIKIWNLQTVTENPKSSKQTSKFIPIQPKYPKTKSYFIPRSKKEGKITGGSFNDLMMAGKRPDRQS